MKEVTYRCNVCREEIVIGFCVGILWLGATAKPVRPADAETHICKRCIDMVCCLTDQAKRCNVQ